MRMNTEEAILKWLSEMIRFYRETDLRKIYKYELNPQNFADMPFNWCKEKENKIQYFETQNLKCRIALVLHDDRVLLRYVCEDTYGDEVSVFNIDTHFTVGEIKPISQEVIIVAQDMNVICILIEGLIKKVIKELESIWTHWDDKLREVSTSSENWKRYEAINEMIDPLSIGDGFFKIRYLGQMNPYRAETKWELERIDGKRYTVFDLERKFISTDKRNLSASLVKFFMPLGLKLNKDEAKEVIKKIVEYYNKIEDIYREMVEDEVSAILENYRREALEFLENLKREIEETGLMEYIFANKLGEET